MFVFSHRDLLLDRIEEADELLVAMVLHVAADDGAIEDVESCEQRGGAVTFVVVRHRPGAAWLHRQSRLGAVECLDSTLLVDRENNRPGAGDEVDCRHRSNDGLTQSDLGLQGLSTWRSDRHRGATYLEAPTRAGSHPYV